MHNAEGAAAGYLSRYPTPLLKLSETLWAMATQTEHPWPEDDHIKKPEGEWGATVWTYEAKPSCDSKSQESSLWLYDAWSAWKNGK